MVSNDQKLRWLLIALGLAAVVLVPFALTLPYSSLSHRDIASELSSPTATDTRLFIALLVSSLFVLAVAPYHTVTKPNAFRKATLTALAVMLLFIALNAVSFLVRGGPTVGAYGFPFQIREWGGPPNILQDSFDHTALWTDIAIALFASFLMGAVHLKPVSQAQPVKRVASLLCLATAVYIGLFSYWWLSSKTLSAVDNGVQRRGVQMHQTQVMYLTQPMWEPAFWFIEHVCGYRYEGYIAAMEDSAFIFEKKRADTLQRDSH